MSSTISPIFLSGCWPKRISQGRFPRPRVAEVFRTRSWCAINELALSRIAAMRHYAQDSGTDCSRDDIGFADHETIPSL